MSSTTHCIIYRIKLIPWAIEICNFTMDHPPLSLRTTQFPDPMPIPSACHIDLRNCTIFFLNPNLTAHCIVLRLKVHLCILELHNYVVTKIVSYLITQFCLSQWINMHYLRVGFLQTGVISS